MNERRRIRRDGKAAALHSPKKLMKGDTPYGRKKGDES